MKSRRRRGTLPLLAFAFSFWLVVLFILLSVEPDLIRSFLVPVPYFWFFLFLFLAVSSTFSLLLTSMRRGLFIGFGVVAWLCLRLVGLASLVNVVLLVGFLLVFEFALSRRQ